MIADATIKSAIRSAPSSGKNTIELKDGGSRGEDRLALVIRARTGACTAEWYAVWRRDEARKSTKIGGQTYPA